MAEKKSVLTQLFLAIDAGNTRIKWGVHDGAGWVATGAIATVDAGQLSTAWPGAGKVDRAIASNVAGPKVREMIAAACSGAGIALVVIGSLPEQLGVTNGYRNPSQLGSDRWASLVAAHHLVEGHKLVVNAGTALTIDALDAAGHFAGGVIVPGPALMRRSLDQGTAGLRLTEGAFEPFPRATPDAITTGAIVATTGAVMRMAQAMADRGTPPASVVLSGGAAKEIAPHLPFTLSIHENLVLEGLNLIARRS